MKQTPPPISLQAKRKALLLGEKIFSTYQAHELTHGTKILHMAMESHLALLKEVRKAVS